MTPCEIEQLFKKEENPEGLISTKAIVNGTIDKKSSLAQQLPPGVEGIQTNEISTDVLFESGVSVLLSVSDEKGNLIETHHARPDGETLHGDGASISWSPDKPNVGRKGPNLPLTVVITHHAKVPVK